MVKQKNNIGANIKEIRTKKKMSQERLAELCGFSNTTLSAYENGHKKPGLDTIMTIAKRLNVTVERLYYGDENSSFIKSEPDLGKKIVNSLYLLWETNVINLLDTSQFDISAYHGISFEDVYGFVVEIKEYKRTIKRYIKMLNDFSVMKDTYSDPEKYLEFINESTANEINKYIK